jgi:hypothetical protein
MSDDPFNPETYLIALPVWIVMPKSGRGAVGCGSTEGDALAVFTDEDCAERYIKAVGLVDHKAVSVPKEETVKFFEMLGDNAVERVVVDPRGKEGEADVALLPVEKIIEAAREKQQGHES